VGYALGLRKLVIWVDPPSDLFSEHRRARRVGDWAEARRLLHEHAVLLSRSGEK